MEVSRYVHACIVVLIITNVILAVGVFGLWWRGDVKQRDTYASKIVPYELLSPRIAKIDENTLTIVREKFIPTYRPLRDKIESYLKTAEGEYVFYFEDLYSSTWTGLREQQGFVPASLMKVPLATAILKMAEENELGLDTNVTIKKDDLRDDFGNLFFWGENNTYSVKTLLEIMIRDSDNTALQALARHASDERIIEARLSLGLPVASITQSENNLTLSAKQVSSIFRVLYYSTYLDRVHSQQLLELLANTQFNTWLKLGTPSNTVIAHKFGKWVPTKSLHDCGIVYHPKRDYILCVMSRNTPNSEAERMISQISRIVYDYVAET